MRVIAYISPYEWHRGEDFWGIYFLRFRDLIGPSGLKRGRGPAGPYIPRIRVQIFLLMKDPEDRTFEVYIFWDLGILIGPSGLKKGPAGPHGPRIMVLQFLLIKDIEDRTFKLYIFWDLGILIGPSGLKKGPTGPYGHKIRVLIFLLIKDTEDRTFEVYIFWDSGILIGPSGLKRGHIGPRIRFLIFFLMKNTKDRTFEVFIFLRFRDSYRTFRIKERTCRTLRIQDQGPHISPYEWHRGQDFWGLYFLRFKDSYRTLRIKERTCRTLLRIGVLIFILKDTEDGTFGVYIFWDFGILIGPGEYNLTFAPPP